MKAIRDTRIPDTPADLLALYDDPLQRDVAAACWREGYADCLNRPKSWRDAIPAGVLIGPDYELHSGRED